MSQFYILSKKHGPVGNSALWWRPEAAGYTTHLNEAGKFDGAYAEEIRTNSCGDAIPVPCELAERLSHTAVDFSLIRNTEDVW
ncbi:hypothetical protein JL101_035840 (plasmid) [Skermanella rosea]|uniref:hypothetical protein n=1 Tax=Skermanella rosea TaxID=1817965 RepID=UPI001933A891|nr:hypothetical protein [Skermanella rosea]UEM08025.1 hypothetical protein JL101_035840 [Skermanella rosea]